MPEPSPAAAAARTDAGPHADALVDKLEVGCRILLPDYRAGADALMRGLRAGLAGDAAGGLARLDCEFVTAGSEGRMPLGGVLRLSALEGGGATFASGSSVRMNPLLFLRSALGSGSPKGLDGGGNFVDLPGVARPTLLGLQLGAVAGALDDLLAEVSRAAGCPASAVLTLRQVELNRDIPVADARRLAHSLKHAPNPWHRIARARHYAPHADQSVLGNDVTVTWPGDARDQPTRLKFYAKRPDRLRVEVCFDNAAAVAAALPGGRRIPSAGDGAGLAALLGSLAEASVPMLDAMEAHAAAVSGPQARSLDLLAALAPLLRATAPPPRARPGPRPAVSTRRDAEDALFHLLEMGRYDASALRTNGTVRKALHRIHREGGLLAESRGRAALYTVPPTMAAGRLALARSLWPPGGGGGDRGGEGED